MSAVDTILSSDEEALYDKLVQMTVAERDDWVRKQDTVSTRLLLALRDVPAHRCDDHPTYILTDGPLGHGWECEVCGRFLQAG